MLVDGFAFGLSAHELADGLDGVEVIEEDVVNGGGDWHFDVEFLCECGDGLCGGDAFDDAVDLFENFFELKAFAEQFTGGAIAAFRAFTTADMPP